MEILELEDLLEYREIYERELYRYDDDGNRRTDREIEEYLWERHCLAECEDEE